MFLTTIYGVVLLFCTHSIDGQGTLRFDYKFYSEIDGWVKLHRIPANWHNARLRCHLEGSVLASPVDQSMFNVMLSEIWASEIHSPGIFSGIHSTFSPGDYYTIEGVPLARIPVKWAPREPDNFEDSEDCLLFFSNGTMGDVRCKNVYPYICYKKHVGIILNECATGDNEYQLDKRTGSCYKFHRTGKTWDTANTTCVAEGGHLVIINSENEAQVVRDIFEKNPEEVISSPHTGNAYVGVYDLNHRGDWRTVDGQTLEAAGYQAWKPGEPNNRYPGEYCVNIFRTALLNDVACDIRLAFICEKSSNFKTIDVSSTECGTFDREYTLDKRTGSCYKFHRGAQPWSRAFMTCSAEGGYLSIVNSEVEAQVLKEILAMNPENTILSQYPQQASIGFNDWGEHGSWLTIEGKTLKGTGFEQWSTGQPDNTTAGEFCGSISRDGALNDIWCHVNFGFICEKDPRSLNIAN